MELLEDTDVAESTEPTESWMPPLSPRQVEILNNPARILLASGPRFSGKSIVFAHKTMKRAWEIYEANIGIVVSSYKVATGGGVWQDLIDAAHEWAAAGISSEYGFSFEITSTDPSGLPGSKLDTASRTPLFTVRNKFGTNSTIRLISIDNEAEIERKIKTTRFQFFWIVELSNFTQRSIITLCEDQLRATLAQSNPDSPTFLPDADCQLVADTNPAEDGKKNWIYRWFYEHDAGTVPDKYKASVKRFTEKMSVEELFLDDNTFLPPGKKDDLIGKYAGDPVNFERFVLGVWPDGSMDKARLFADVFTDSLIIDNCIDVGELTDTLYSGFDLGPRNKAWCLLEKRLVGGYSCWCALDELAYIDDHVSVEDFTMEVMEKLIAINTHYREKWKNFKGFRFVHWSDSSSWNPHVSDEVGTEAIEVYNASNRQIELRPVDKPAKSVETGVQIIRKLMREERFFTGQNTPRLNEALKSIKRSSKGGKTMDSGDRHKHICDALRYPIFSESIDDMVNDPMHQKFKNRRTLHLPL